MSSLIDTLDEEDTLRALGHIPSSEPFDLREYNITVDLEAMWYKSAVEVNQIVWSRKLEQLSKWHTIVEVVKDPEHDYWEARFELDQVYQSGYIYEAYSNGTVSFIDDVHHELLILTKSNEYILD